MSVILEYIWLDADQQLRSKTKVMNRSELITFGAGPLLNDTILAQAPEWNYDGSSTGQGTLHHSEVIIRPVACYRDPFRRDDNGGSRKTRLLLCETYNPDGTPHITNTRNEVAKYFSKEANIGLKPKFGLEQEFFMIEPRSGKPLGFPTNDKYRPKEQADYYCGVGATNAYGRDYMEKILDNLLYMGLSITGMNLEVAPGQGEFQVCDYGISAADQLIIMRYVIQRTLEEHDIIMDISPKLKYIESTWNGSGCHTNFSTAEMMDPNTGELAIIALLDRMDKKHKEHIEVYGSENHLRLTGKNETSSIEKFSYGVGSRGSSIRIPYKTDQDKCGYIEDRRPAGNMDPYKVIYRILKTYNDE